jgi:hypothetical protein
MSLREEISKTLGKFFIEYSVRNYNSNWNHPDKIIKQEDIQTILQECYNLEDEYADKIISKFEKRIDKVYDKEINTRDFSVEQDDAITFFYNRIKKEMLKE